MENKICIEKIHEQWKRHEHEMASIVLKEYLHREPTKSDIAQCRIVRKVGGSVNKYQLIYGKVNLGNVEAEITPDSVSIQFTGHKKQ